MRPSTTGIHVTIYVTKPNFFSRTILQVVEKMVSAEGIEPSTYCLLVKLQIPKESVTFPSFRLAEIGGFQPTCYVACYEPPNHRKGKGKCRTTIYQTLFDWNKAGEQYTDCLLSLRDNRRVSTWTLPTSRVHAFICLIYCGSSNSCIVQIRSAILCFIDRR